MKKILYTILALGALLTSCRTLDIPNPNKITDEQIIGILEGDDENAKAPILAAIATGLQNYFNMVHDGSSWTSFSAYPQNSHVDQDFLMTLRGNDVVLGSEDIPLSDAHAFAYALETDSFRADKSRAFWCLSADMLTAANKTLLYVTEAGADASPETVGMYRGRALCVRAYAYMLLMERFQDAYLNGGKDGKGMPIYTLYAVNDPAPISSATETYEYIMEWLDEAVERLQVIGYTDDVNDIDLGVAQFLRARTALWIGDYDKAIASAKDLTDHFKTFIKEENYGAKDATHKAVCEETAEVYSKDNAFLCLAVNPEAIIGFPSGTGSNTYMPYFANVYGGSSLAGGNVPAAPRIDDRLYAKIDSRDVRHDNFTTTAQQYTYITDTDGKLIYTSTIPAYAGLKFAASVALSTTERDNKLTCDNYTFRSSEAYLMLAEAYAMKNQDAQAKETLNKLLAARTKAGEPTMTCDNYSGHEGLSTLQMVQLQSRIELWLENGREFYNNKRWNIAVNREGSKVHYSNTKSIPVSKMKLSIPTEEQTTNTNWAK